MFMMYNDENQNGCVFTQSIYYEIGILNEVLNIRVIEMIDLVENYSRYAIRFELAAYDENGEYIDTYYTNVMADETEQLIFAMDTIIKKIQPSKTENYSEVLFQSSQGYTTGCFWLEKESKWYMYLRMGNQSDTQLILGIKDYKKLLTLVKKAEKVFK
jgi:hypothetical protein